MDDLISRQAAIDAMIEDKIQTKIYITSTAERDFEVFNSACDRHAKMLKELPSAQPEQQWIPCSERLPKKSGQYYVSGGGKAWICEFLIIPNLARGWCDDALNPVVRAWMPLPEPYREGKQDERSDR